MPDKRKATFQPYDMDTAAGTNNSGVLMFGYGLEDTDTVSSIISGGDDGGRDAPVFNAQDSVLWNNFRDCFRNEITQMYRSLRTSRALTYNDIMERRKSHQSYWPEAMFNEDQYEKHLVPLIDPVTVDDATGELIRTDRYLTMIQGSKEEQFKWWLYNRFRYMDSKFVTGDAANNIISMRVFNSGTLTLTPAIDLYVGVSFGGGTTVALKRTTANVSQSFTYQAATGVTEMETWIYSGDLITDLGDLSVFYGNEFDLSKATRLRRLQIGSDAEGYSNANLVTLDMRNMGLLEYVDLQNCPNLAIPINLEGSPRLEEAYFEGTSITGIDLAEGGSIETLHLPDTITTLTLINLSKLTDFQCDSLENVSRLMLSNIDPDVVDPVEALNSIMANSQVNIQGLYLEMDDADDIEDFLDLLDTMQGVSRERSANGTWLYHEYDTAQVSGELHTDALTGEQIASYNSRYPYIRVRADYVQSTLTYMSFDNTTVLKAVTCLNGVPQEASPSGPSKPNSPDGHYSYTFVGWNRSADAETDDPTAITDVIADRTVYPAYSKTVRTYTVTWMNGSTTIRTDSNVAWGTTVSWGQAMPTNSDSQTAIGWSYDLATPITGDTTITAVYKPMYTHTFIRSSTDGGGTLYTVRVEEGQTVTYGGSTPTTTQGSATDYPFEGWNPVPGTSTANTTYTAVFGSPVEDVEITDSWDTIIAKIDNGTYKTAYKIGNYKPLDLGTQGTVNMQIVAMDADDLASGGKAPLTFIAKELLATTHNMNSTNTTTGGYEASAMRTYLDSTILSLIPSNVAARLQRVNKVQATLQEIQTTIDKLWIPGNREIFNTTDYETTGVIYTRIYKDTASRIKTNISSGSADWWWLRSVSNSSRFRGVAYDGEGGRSSASVVGGIALGFCLGLEAETITDTWAEIFAAEQDGTYSTKYSIGDTKEIDLGTEGKHLMEIVAFDTDDKADGSGKAKITWISKDLLPTVHRMNATNTTAGGWASSEMRSYLGTTIKPLIPETVRSAIVPVTKISSTYENGAIVVDGQTTTDDVWIPGTREIFDITTYESTGAVYSSRFASASDRIKKRRGLTGAWWTRSAYTAERFRVVNDQGINYGNRGADTANGVALGFCTSTPSVYPEAKTADGAYGVEWDYSQSSPALTRKGLAASFTDPSPAESVSGSGSSPFDNILPWSGMKRYCVINGEYVPDTDSRYDAAAYDTLVYIPEFYYTAYKDTANSKWLWAISPTAKTGYMKHPGSGKYVGRYHTSGDSSAVYSKTLVPPLVSTSQADFRTYSTAKGTGWGMLDLATWSAIQMLYLVEYANFDSQTILGSGWKPALGYMGGTDSAAYHTVKATGAHNQYRWIEDPFSNCYDWIDGFVGSNNSNTYAAANDTYAGGNGDLNELGFELPSSGAIHGFGYNGYAAWAFIPDTASGSDYTTYVCDRVYSSSSLYPAYVGGNYSNSASFGFFHFNASNPASYWGGDLGSRLIKS